MTWPWQRRVPPEGGPDPRVRDARAEAERIAVALTLAEAEVAVLLRRVDRAKELRTP